MNVIIEVHRQGEWRKLTTVSEENEKLLKASAVRAITAWSGYFTEPLRAIMPQRYGQPLEVIVGGSL